MKMNMGGAETHIFELAKALFVRGHEVTVASGGGRYAEELSSLGIKTVTVPLYSKNPLLMAAGRRRLSALIKREKFDIVHAHARIPALICGGLQKKYGFRFVTTAHYDFKVTPLLRRLTDWGEHCFAVSPDIKDYVAANYDFPKENISVIPNGIDTEKFSPSGGEELLAEFPSLAGKTVILHVSRLESYSSLCAGRLAAAMRKTGEKYPAAVLVIVGGGSELERIRSIAGETNKALGREAVIAVGARADVYKFMKAASIFAGPSRAALEAMACGVPTVVTGSQGHIGIFSDESKPVCERTNFCGRGLPLPDEAALRRDVETLLSMTEDDRAAVGRACRKYVCENYSVDRMTDLCEKEYLRLSKIVTGKRHDFTLCGYYGFGNTGDEALEKCIISSIRKRNPSADICVMTHTPKKTSRRFSVATVQRMNIPAVMKVLKNTDTFIFGGGNLLQDKTSFASLLYYSKMLSWAKKKGCRTVIFANGLGPFESAMALKITARALSAADAVSMRETYSLELAGELCPGLSPALTFDPAIMTVPATGAKRDGKYFVVSPKFFSETATDELIGAVKTLSERHKMKAYILPMYEKEDMKICMEVAHETGGELLPCGMSPEDVSGVLSGAEVLIGSRLHSLVLSTVALCPAVALSDDIKLFSYMEMIAAEGDEAFCLSEMSMRDDIISLVDAVLSRSGEIRKSLGERLPFRRGMYEKSIDMLISK